VNQGDPTDNALAAIASILDQPEVSREPATPPPLPEEPRAPEAPVQAEAPVHVDTPVETQAPVQVQTQTHSPIEAHGYSKHGPGPMAAIRFKWTVRAENGEYFVDETIGENSNPLVTGPLSREAAIQLVDNRESEARLRFDQLKHEMTGRAAAANLVRKEVGEA
jgi:hypothetical protein